MNEHCNDMERVEEIAPSSPLVAREWRLGDGSREVRLKDDSAAGWEAYCAAIVAERQRDPA